MRFWINKTILSNVSGLYSLVAEQVIAVIDPAHRHPQHKILCQGCESDMSDTWRYYTMIPN